MNEKTKKVYVIAIVATLAIFVIGVILFILSLRSGKTEQNEPEPTPTPIPIEFHPDESTPEEAETESEPEEREFQLVEDSGKDTLRGKISLGITENEKYIASLCTEEAAVPGLTTFLGNQVYKIPLSALDEIPEGADNDALYVQLYGEKPNIVDWDGYVFDYWTWPREEHTGKRIYVYNYQREIDLAQLAWDKGQKILNGEDEGPASGIILNGRLLSRAYTAKSNGELYIPLRNVAEEFDPGRLFDNKTAQKLTIPIEQTDYRLSLIVPYNQFNRVGEEHNSDEYFTYGNTDPNCGELWEDEFRIGDGDECYVPAKELSRYTGWTITTNGRVTSIVTDERDVSDNFILDTQGNRSARSQLMSGGNRVVKYTDLEDIVSSMPDDVYNEIYGTPETASEADSETETEDSGEIYAESETDSPQIEEGG